MPVGLITGQVTVKKQSPGVTVIVKKNGSPCGQPQPADPDGDGTYVFAQMVLFQVDDTFTVWAKCNGCNASAETGEFEVGVYPPTVTPAPNLVLACTCS